MFGTKKKQSKPLSFEEKLRDITSSNRVLDAYDLAAFVKEIAISTAYSSSSSAENTIPEMKDPKNSNIKAQSILIELCCLFCYSIIKDWPKISLPNFRHGINVYVYRGILSAMKNMNNNFGWDVRDEWPKIFETLFSRCVVENEPYSDFTLDRFSKYAIELYGCSSMPSKDLQDKWKQVFLYVQKTLLSANLEDRVEG